MKWTLDVVKTHIEIANTVQLRKELIIAHRCAIHEPIIAMINAPDGSCLAVGLGLHRSVLNYIAPGGWPSRHAVDNKAGDGLVEYMLAGHVSQVQLRCTVNIDDAIDACIEFMETEKTTEKLEWQED